MASPEDPIPTPPATPVRTAPGGLHGRSPLVAFLAVLVVALVGLGLQVGPGGAIPDGETLVRIAGAVLLAAGWMVAALAIGTGVWRSLPAIPATLGRSTVVRWATGIGILLWMDLVLGSLGLLGRDHRWLAVLVLGVPILMWLASRPWIALRGWTRTDPPWILVPVALPLAVLLVAAASVPGWLWASEFAGFDVLSYHLQVPREWWYAGGIVELPHNAYAYLPGGVSAAFLHLMTIVGDPQGAAIACQMLVASATIVAMLATAELVRGLRVDGTAGIDRDPTPALASVLLLATPWVVVVGSLAYDESFVLVFATVALGLVLRIGRGSDRPDGDATPTAGIVLGLLLGASVIAKASSVVLVVLPVALGAAIAIPPRRWLPVAVGTTIGGVLVCLPWLVRTTIWTGNPVFPLATDLLGLHDWSSNQGGRFQAAHASPGAWAGLEAIVREFLLDDLFVAATPGEPLRPQWWWLPGLGLIASVALVVLPGRNRSGRRRSTALLVVLLAMILAWAFLTHAKARFLLPTAPILAAAIATLAAPMFRHRLGTGVLLVAAWVVSLGPVIHGLGERDGAFAWGVGARDAFDGTLEARLMADADPNTAETLRRNASLTSVLRTLSPKTRTLLVGIATPFHLPMERDGGTADRIAYTTVWTRGPLERAFSENPGTSSDPHRIDPVLADLRDQGFTHLVIAPTMLEVWSRSGWLDPDLTPDRLAALAGRPELDIVHRFPDGGVLLALDPDS